MSCAYVVDRSVTEQYVAGLLSDEERDAFEAHYFSCPRCFGELRAIAALQDEVARHRSDILAESDVAQDVAQAFRPAEPSAPLWIPLLAAAAAVAIAVAIWKPPSPPATTIAQQPLPSATETPSPPSRDALLALARVEPPAFVALTLRSASEPQAFDDAMAAYAAHNYQDAAKDLKSVIAAQPVDVQANFYLAVSLLMTDDVAQAIDRLRVVLGAGDTPFRQTATILLAKARIREGNLDEAERQLEQISSASGARATDARTMLDGLRAARGGDRRP